LTAEAATQTQAAQLPLQPQVRSEDCAQSFRLPRKNARICGASLSERSPTPRVRRSQLYPTIARHCRHSCRGCRIRSRHSPPSATA
jgi:hypothetical protein